MCRHVQHLAAVVVVMHHMRLLLRILYVDIGRDDVMVG